MAKTYYAATKIKHGTRVEDGSQDGKIEEKTFEVNDKVTGLDAETMKDLWRAGALTDQAPEKPEENSEEEATPAEDPKNPAPKKAAAPKQQ